MTSKTRHLHERLRSGQLVKVAGAHNGIGARLVEEAGFDAVWASGFEISASCGLPDANILSMSECLQASDNINRATSLPVLADCDSGYGGVNNVMHLVREYERHGIAGVCIEDKLFPKANSFYGTAQQLVACEEFCDKLRGAVAARQQADFLLVARTEALIAGRPLSEALARARAYAQAGADAIVVHSKARSAEEIQEFMRHWDGRTPVIAIPTTYGQVSNDELASMGIRAVIFANHGLRSAVRSMRTTLGALAKSGRIADIEPEIATMADIFALQRIEDWRSLS